MQDGVAPIPFSLRRRSGLAPAGSAGILRRSLIPGGLGTYEAACLAMLTLFHVPVEAALGATLLQRGFTYWLPMLPGLWLSRREVRAGGPHGGLK